jgi:chaperonin cofactor prefoldin
LRIKKGEFLKMLWFVSKKKYDILLKNYKEFFEGAKKEIDCLNQKVKKQQAEIDELRPALKKALENDHRDKKGRFTKAKG